MPIPLSPKTQEVAAKLFSEPALTEVKKRLVEEISEEIPFCEDRTSEGMERIRFSVMKLLKERGADYEHAYTYAKTDWRDLFMAAGFGHSPTEHLEWYENLIQGGG